MGKRCLRVRMVKGNGAEARIERAEMGKGQNPGTEEDLGPVTEKGRGQEIAKTAPDQGTVEGQDPGTGAIAGGQGPSQGTGTGAGAGADSAREQCTGKINVK